MQTETLPITNKFVGIRIKKILVPIDFSPACKKALDYALRIGEGFGSTITLLHIVEPEYTPGFVEAPSASEQAELVESEKKLRTLAASSRRGRIGIKWEVVKGAAGYQIIEAAKEEDVDLIVIATHGLTAWKHFCIGSTAERVARAAPCPVLVVREKEHEFI